VYTSEAAELYDTANEIVNMHLQPGQACYSKLICVQERTVAPAAPEATLDTISTRDILVKNVIGIGGTKWSTAVDSQGLALVPLEVRAATRLRTNMSFGQTSIF
jgi:hypothetical protein